MPPGPRLCCPCSVRVCVSFPLLSSTLPQQRIQDHERWWFAIASILVLVLFHPLSSSTPWLRPDGVNLPRVHLFRRCVPDRTGKIHRGARGIDPPSISWIFHRYLWGRYRWRGDVGIHSIVAHRVARARLRSCFAIAMMHEEVNEEDGDHERREEDGQVRQGTRLRRTARPRNADANTRRRTKHEARTRNRGCRGRERRREAIYTDAQDGERSIERTRGLRRPGETLVLRNARLTGRSFGHVVQFAVALAKFRQVGYERDVFRSGRW